MMKVFYAKVRGDDEEVIVEAARASFKFSYAGPFIRPYLEVVCVLI